MGVSLWDLSLCVTEPVVIQGLQTAYALGGCSTAPALSTRLPRSGSHTEGHTNTGPRSGLRVATHCARIHIFLFLHFLFRVYHLQEKPVTR